MDAYKGGMYIENMVDDRTRSMLCDGLFNGNTHINCIGIKI